ncbi:prepilin-type N-terminal cleavage/methylation domain-containing protein [candidate division WWE3 bacterium]|jgi:prepilin-type N-terminal cleavage/methylation domain-containing protein|uniref:Prepilin-type N-terminal cleavage/methylation domain-containing protein n=1 Tax=candidate division WWE3 bacterium TaxID=2053526 RepID=A0A3A4ZEC1_UNCKA|nr:MAG: prepilin-type N-terminal cleavage/methylation domain-containing protein [candidate division WWE3 bacterium]
MRRSSALKCIPVKTSGFTLVELLVVVTIIVLVTGALIPSFAGYIRNQNVKQAQEQLKSDMRNIQNKALTGTLSDTTIGPNPVEYWGIRFNSGAGTGSNRYEFFISDTNTTCPDPIPVAQAQGHSEIQNTLEIKVTGGFRCMYFSIRDGSINTVNFPGTQLIVGYVGSTTSGDCRRILFNTRGLIYTNSSLLCT